MNKLSVLLSTVRARFRLAYSGKPVAGQTMAEVPMLINRSPFDLPDDLFPALVERDIMAGKTAIDLRLPDADPYPSSRSASSAGLSTACAASPGFR